MRVTLRAPGGFTLIELMVSLAIASILLIALSAMFVQYNRLYTLENARAALQQEMRAAMDIMIQDIQMAGANTSAPNLFKIQNANLTRFRFTTDLDNDGVLDTGGGLGCEMITYKFQPAPNYRIDWICNENTPSAITPQPILGGITGPSASQIKVTGLLFGYRNKQNQPEGNSAEITGVQITIQAEILAGRAGWEPSTLSAFVTLRNAGPNASKT